MNTIQLVQQEQEASGFTRRPSYGLDEPWDARLDFQEEQIKKLTSVEPCPFDEAQNGDYRPSTTKLSSTGCGCCHHTTNFDGGHQSCKTSLAEAREREEEKDRDYPPQPYRVKCIQGWSTTSNSSKSIQQHSPENSFRGGFDVKESHLFEETFEIDLHVPSDLSRTEWFAKQHVSSVQQGIPSITRGLHHGETDFVCGETKRGSSADESSESESSKASEYVELKPRRNEQYSNVTDKRMPTTLRQGVDDLRRRLNCLIANSIVAEMENKVECEEEGGDMDYYNTYKARSAAALEQQHLGSKSRLAPRTKMPDDLSWPPVQEEGNSATKKKEQFAARLVHKRATADEYTLNQHHQRPSRSTSTSTTWSTIVPTKSPNAGAPAIECLLGDQAAVVLLVDRERQTEEQSPTSRDCCWRAPTSTSTPEELIRRESPRVSPPKQTPYTTSTSTRSSTSSSYIPLERKMGSGPVSSDQSPFGCLATMIEPAWAMQAFKKDWGEWNDLTCTSEWQQQQQQQSVQEAWDDEQKKSAASTPSGKEKSSPASSTTQPGRTPARRSAVTSAAIISPETKQEINSLMDDWGYTAAEGSAPARLAESGSQSSSSSRCVRVLPCSHSHRTKFKQLRCIFLRSAWWCQKKHTTDDDDEDIPSGGESMTGTDLEDDATLRGVAFLEE
jgi:hypothetical protein